MALKGENLFIQLWGDSSIGRAFGLQPDDDGFDSLSLHCDRGVMRTRLVVSLQLRVGVPSVTFFKTGKLSAISSQQELCAGSLVARTSVFQTDCREFESRSALYYIQAMWLDSSTGRAADF